MSTETKRQKRFGGVIQQDLAEIFLREGSAWLPNTMITVNQVKMTPDLGVARVYLSFFNMPDSEEEAINTVKDRAKDIRYKLGAKIKSQVKKVPELEFFLDNSVKYSEHMDQLFNEISKEKRQEDNE